MKKIIDLTIMNTGKRYEDTYGNYVLLFENIFKNKESETIIIKNPPYCWIPLLIYMGVAVEGGQIYFKHDHIIKEIFKTLDINLFKIDRTLLESFTCLRPELVDVLWKIDWQWEKESTLLKTMDSLFGSNWKVPEISKDEILLITNNGSFHRPEIKNYFNKLKTFIPTKKKAILLPCAADKPYPSELHSKVMEFMPKDYHIIIVTGVLGVLPMELWGHAPNYDSGIPNRWRVLEMVQKYFSTFTYEKLVVYCDFYNEAIYKALQFFNNEKIFLLPIKFYSDYINLLNPELLQKLKNSL